MPRRANQIRRCQAVILRQRRALAAIMLEGKASREFFHAVVMWPSRPASAWSFETAILTEYTASEDGETELPEYRSIARQAARSVWEQLTGIPETAMPESDEVATAVVQGLQPVVVSVSGIQKPLCAALAEHIAHAIVDSGPWPEV